MEIKPLSETLAGTSERELGEIAIKNDLQLINSDADLNRLVSTDRLTLEDQLREYLQSPFGILLVRAYCALGKTTILVRLLAELHLPFIYLTERHKLAEAVIKELHETGFTQFIYLIGKDRCCTDDYGKRLTDMGSRIPKIYCENMCPNRKECQYWKNLEMIRTNPSLSIVSVHHQVAKVLLDLVGKETHFLILDENIFNSLKEEFALTFSQIVELAKYKFPAKIKPILDILNALFKEGNQETDNSIESDLYVDNFERNFRDLLQNVKTDTLKNCANKIDAVLTAQMEHSQNAQFENIFWRLVQLKKFLWQFPSTIKFLRFESKPEPALHFTFFERISRYNKCIILSATLNQELIKALFPRCALHQ